ncbi:hypothetical protein HMSSN139_34390 [Paenibacillus sp. HMSSN-139]|nr:hypothetical protein HMSSN139_34390 [Paenibacillus sp. HMSSN-139]
MFNNFLRTNKVAMWLLTVIRVYLGYQWIEAGYHKLTGGFDAAGFLTGAIANSTGEHPAVQGWWATFLQHFALPTSISSTSWCLTANSWSASASFSVPSPPSPH